MNFNELIFPLILAVIGSNGLFAFVTFLITRKDSKKEDELKVLQERLSKLERDGVRTQLLVLMNHYPNSIQEIMKVATHYFKELEGDWYMTSLFNKWLEENNIGKPEWFNPED